MKINTSEELSNAVNTIRNFCKERIDCYRCPFNESMKCLLNNFPRKWSKILRIKTYSVEVDINE